VIDIGHHFNFCNCKGFYIRNKVPAVLDQEGVLRDVKDDEGNVI